MKAELICVGTELLLGDILNTNAQYLSQRLADLGVSVFYQSVVGDNETRLLETIFTAKKRSDLIIFSGGLGPTSDDITKETVAKALDLALVRNEEEAQKILGFFANRPGKMTPNNLKQADIPEGAVVLNNNNGTAPGILIEKDETTFIILPGPPNELIPMFEENVVGYLRQKTSDRIISRTLKLIGIGESSAASTIQHLIDGQTNPSIAPYAKLAEVHLRITAKAEQIEEAIALLDQCEGEIRTYLGDFIYTTEDITLEEAIVAQLIKQKKTIATAESCTAGLLSSSLVNCAGASEIFKEGIIVYSNDAKIKRLGVLPDTLERYGAVSEETVKEMAIGIKTLANSDIGIGISGIAGPGGGTPDKPVGLIYIAIADQQHVYVKKLQLNGNRMKVRTNATKQALIFLYQIIKENSKL